MLLAELVVELHRQEAFQVLDAFCLSVVALSPGLAANPCSLLMVLEGDLL